MNEVKVYRINSVMFPTLRDFAIKLKEVGFNVLVWSAKKGEHGCKVYCKDLSINLENVRLTDGHKTMRFCKFTHPFETKWSGYYYGGFVR